MALGGARRLLEPAGIPPALASGQPDEALILGDAPTDAAIGAFVQALARHRNFARESDPPIV
jgi:catalase